MDADMGPAARDVQAWHQARVREEASRAVARERLIGAVHALTDEGWQVADIAQALEVSRAQVITIRAGRWAVPAQRPKIKGGISDWMLTDTDQGREYRAAHDAAWRHYPPAQGDYTLGVTGNPTL